MVFGYYAVGSFSFWRVMCNNGPAILVHRHQTYGIIHGAYSWEVAMQIHAFRMHRYSESMLFYICRILCIMSAGFFLHKNQLQTKEMELHVNYDCVGSDFVSAYLKTSTHPKMFMHTKTKSIIWIRERVICECSNLYLFWC